MKIFNLSIFLFLCVNISFAQKTTFHTSQFIATLKADVDLQQINGSLQIQNPAVQELNRTWKLDRIEQFIKSKPKTTKKNRPDTDRILLFSFKEEIEVLTAIEAYQQTAIFEIIEPNFIGHGAGVEDLTPNDAQYYNRQWSHYNDGTFDNDAEDDADIDMEEAWDITTGNPQTIIAVLDSGFKLDHPELNGRFWSNLGETQSNGLDDDNNGFIDDDLGWDFINNDNDPSDDHGHGTNVAGIMVATGNNEIGYAGVDWQAQVMIGKILNSNNSGTYAGFTQAVYYAIDNGAQIINMSAGGSGFSGILQTACDYAHDNDVAIFVSMMNTNSNTPFYPAAYSSTIAIGATDTDDDRAVPFFWDSTTGSNFGNHIDICAPGNYMYGLSSNSNTNYNSYWGGTSQACPLAAGVGSLIKGLNPNFTVEEIREILRSTADDQVGSPSEDSLGFDQYYGAGRLNAHAAILAASPPINTQDVFSKIAEIEINPNPVVKEGELSISISSELTEEATFSIVDIQGRTLLSKSINLSLGSLSLKAPTEASIYFLKLETKRGQTQSLKFIVQ